MRFSGGSRSACGRRRLRRTGLAVPLAFRRMASGALAGALPDILGCHAVLLAARAAAVRLEATDSLAMGHTAQSVRRLRAVRQGILVQLRRELGPESCDGERASDRPGFALLDPACRKVLARLGLVPGRH